MLTDVKIRQAKPREKAYGKIRLQLSRRVTDHSEVCKRNRPRREVRTHLQFATHRFDEPSQGAHE